jgi:hypothetical protein
LRGRRVGTDGSGHAAPGPTRSSGQAASRLVSFWCHAGHTTTVRLAADIPVPPSWQCSRCGAAAGPDVAQPPPPPDPSGERGRTHLDYLRMRRTPEEGEQALAEALDRLRAMREAGEPPGRR